jgi:hypothetical protein
MPQQTFTRKEVRQLLKRQLQTVSMSLGRMPINMTLAKGFHAKEYSEEIHNTAKRIRNVNIIKF